MMLMITRILGTISRREGSIHKLIGEGIGRNGPKSREKRTPKEICRVTEKISVVYRVAQPAQGGAKIFW